MNQGGTRPKHQPTAWVYLTNAWVYLTNDCTIRWQRGDHHAYLFKGNKLGSWSTDGLLATLPVSRTGWTDLAEVKLTGEKWRRSP